MVSSSPSYVNTYLDTFLNMASPLYSRTVAIDLVHDVQYIQSSSALFKHLHCRKHTDEAQANITKINGNVEAVHVVQYCENTTVNLRLSAYAGEIRFEGDIPFSAEENHGLGAKSIKAAAQKHQGLYSFSAENGIFALRVILQ